MPQILSAPTIRRAAWSAACLLLLVCSVSTAIADSVIRDGLGPISSGRGGTNIAHADNGVILLDNPAALVNIEGHHLFELSGDLLLTDLHYAETGQGQTSGRAAFRPLGMPQISLIRKSCDGQWAFGLGAFAPAGFGAAYTLDNPIVGRQTYRSLCAMAKVLPGVAYKVNDRLSVGGAFGLAVSHAQLEGPFFLQSGPLQGAPAVLDLWATGVTWTWNFGMQYELSEKTTLGLTYKSETRFKMDGRVDADVYLPGPAIVHSAFDAQLNHTWPRSVGLGMKHRLCDHRSISADLIWFNWSAAYDSLGIRLSNPSNQLLAGYAPIHDEFPFNWRDSVSLRLGYEHAINSCNTLRAGYVYHANSIPDGTLTPYIPAIIEHAFSVGYGKKLRNCQFDAAYQFSYGPDRTVGTSDLIGGDFDSSTVRAQAHWIFLGLTWKR